MCVCPVLMLGIRHTGTDVCMWWRCYREKEVINIRLREEGLVC